MELMQKDQYSLDSSFEKAFLGMCSSREDIALIKEYFKPPADLETDDSRYYTDFYLELYDKLGMDDDYLSIAKSEGCSSYLIDKLISMGRLEEALAECNNCKTKDPFWNVESKKMEILKKLGRNDEFKKLLLGITKKEGDINDALRLKKESAKDEWELFLKQIISDAKRKSRGSFLSKMYYNENDFKRAYEHSKSM